MLQPSGMPRGLARAIVFMLAAATPSARPRPYLDAAVDAARWIRGSAIKTDAGLAWPADPADPTSVNATLYSGSPGVVLFLVELSRATGREEYLADARAGADELLAQLPRQKQTGLYTGIAGIGFTLNEVFRATGDSKYRDGARLAVRMLTDRAVKTGDGVQWSEVTDIIGGNSGTGLFLLYAADVMNEPSARELATRAADRLLELAVSEHGGLRWSMDPNFPRRMPNFSHGTAGIAYFLARVYAVTLDRRYLNAALGGARYLLQIAKTGNGWCLIPHNQPDGLELFYLGWCHGPVGTARLWRQLQILQQDTSPLEWELWTTRSARALMESGIPARRTPGFWNNVSQCCGSAGVAQFFLDMYEARPRNPAYLAFARTMTDDLLARATRDAKGMRWVQAEHRARPELLVAQTGYMQGAAGIGMWLLRLDGVEHGRPPTIRFPDDPW